MDFADPPSLRAVVRGILGGALGLASLVLVIVLISSGQIEWRLVALLLTLWSAWGFFDFILGSVVEPLGRFLGNALTGGAMPGHTRITIEQETAMLERVLDGAASSAHRVMLAGIRLAEIYRTHQHDAAKADALIDRLVTRYPDAPELQYVRLR
ncbi:MAG TPA: hypothetical protein VJN39_08620 [Gemmatimonadales bacterium]|nr:hypothetical protein [Gemmatimonadales bacterium]